MDTMWLRHALSGVVLFHLASFIHQCLGLQKAITIENPCTEGQKYTLGRDGMLVVSALGHETFTTCTVSLRAEDIKYQCSKLCFSVEKFSVQTCDLRLAFYDTGVWNYGSANPSLEGSCSKNIQRKDWCSSGTTATLRLENLRGRLASLVGQYGFELTVVSMCSDDERKYPLNSDDPDTVGSEMNTTVIIIVAVLGCVVICTCVVVMFLVWFVKRRAAEEQHRTPAHRTSLPQLIGTSYHPVQVTDNCSQNTDSVDESGDCLMKGDDAPQQRIWQEPSAPPQEGDTSTENRPPSYCSTPPAYRPPTEQANTQQFV